MIRLRRKHLPMQHLTLHIALWQMPCVCGCVCVLQERLQDSCRLYSTLVPEVFLWNQGISTADCFPSWCHSMHYKTWHDAQILNPNEFFHKKMKVSTLMSFPGLKNINLLWEKKIYSRTEPRPWAWLRRRLGARVFGTLPNKLEGRLDVPDKK